MAKIKPIACVQCSHRTQSNVGKQSIDEMTTLLSDRLHEQRGIRKREPPSKDDSSLPNSEASTPFGKLEHPIALSHVTPLVARKGGPNRNGIRDLKIDPFEQSVPMQNRNGTDRTRAHVDDVDERLAERESEWYRHDRDSECGKRFSIGIGQDEVFR